MSSGYLVGSALCASGALQEEKKMRFLIILSLLFGGYLSVKSGEAVSSKPSAPIQGTDDGGLPPPPRAL